MTHELKIYPQYYCRVADGSKTFEVRKNDRGFQPGDFVILREFDPTRQYVTSDSPGIYIESPNLKFKIGYVFTIDSEKVVFSLLKCEEV